MSPPPPGRQQVALDRRAPNLPAADRPVGPPGAPSALAVAAAVAVPLVLGAGVAVSSKPALLALAGISVIVGLMVALASPRWALVATLFLLIGYVPDVVGGSGHKLASAVLPVLLVLAVVIRHVTNVERVAIPIDTKWFVFFGVALLVVTATAGHRSTSELTDFVGFALLAAVMMILVDSRLWLRRVMWAIVAAAAMLAVLSVAQQITRSYGRTYGGFAVITPDESGMRSGGPLSPDYFAQMLVVVAALAGYLALAARSAFERALAVGTVLFALVAVYFTLSRGALVAVVAAAIATALLRGVPVSKVVVAGVVIVIGGLLVLPAGLQHRIGDLATLRSGGATTDSSLRGRVAENLAAVEIFRDHAIVGVGPDNFERHYLAYAQRIGLDSRAEVRGAHSLFLQALAELGLVGSIPFFALLWMGLRRSWQARRETVNRRAGPGLGLLVEGCFVAWIAFLVSAAWLHLSYPRYLWIFLALALTAGQLRDRTLAS